MRQPAIYPEPVALTAGSDTRTGERVSNRPAGRWLPGGPTWLRLLGALAAGALLYASFPPRTLWWLAPPAFAVLGLVLRGRRVGAGFGYGLLFGLGFFLPLIYWLQDFLGADFGSAPWLAVSLIEALLIAVGTAAMTVAARLPGAPVWMAALYVGTEALRSRFPLNGFPWGRAGFSQPDGPLLALAAVGGAPLVGFAVALTGFGLARLVPRLRSPRRLAGPVITVLVPLLASAALWPSVGTAAQTGTLRVAVVQGNAPNVGLALMSASEQIRANHIAQTRRLTADIRSGRVPRPDLVIWPETAVRLAGDPAGDAELAGVLRELGVPTLIGAQLRQDGRGTNSVLYWDPARGPGPQRYDKLELVPFAEYVPLRAIARWFTPFVDGTGDLTPGSEPGVFRVAGTRVGAVICYEAAYDYPARQAIDRGAELLAVPTNNAWYGRSEMSYQQLGMSRLRAVEHGRAVVVSATSGVSAFISPDGSVRQQTSLFTPDSLVGTVPLRDVRTTADRLGPWPEWLLIAAGLLGPAAGIAFRRLRVRGE